MKPPYLASVLAVAAVALCTGCSWTPWSSWGASRPVDSRAGGDPAAARLLDEMMSRPMPAHTRADEVRAPVPVLTGPIVTIDSYQGDASILLKRIAAANGKGFDVTGTEPRLPLFVHVHAVNKDLRAVLADIGSQFGGRADLVLTPSQILIQYKRAKTL